MNTPDGVYLAVSPHLSQHTCMGRAVKDQSARYANQGPTARLPGRNCHQWERWPARYSSTGWPSGSSRKLKCVCLKRSSGWQSSQLYTDRSCRHVDSSLVDRQGKVRLPEGVIRLAVEPAVERQILHT